MTAVDKKVIGSDFATADASWRLSKPQTPPWELDGEVTEYAQTGRQILSALATHLRTLGRNRLLIPGHFCESIIRPFQRKGFKVQRAPVDRPLRVRIESLQDLILQDKNATVVIGLSLFGEEPALEYAEFTKWLAAHRVPLIEDETHRVFRAGGAQSEFAIGSLRKLLPVGDGAYLRHSHSRLLLEKLPTDASSAKRWEAMDELAAGIEGSLSRLRSSNSCLESKSSPHAMSARTSDLIKTLDFSALASRRQQNAKVLVEELNRLNVRTLDRDWTQIVPSHVVIETPNAVGAQARLAEQQIFSPIHWSPPAEHELSSSWRTDLLSLPIDHRYNESDMRRVTSVLSELVNHES